MQLGYMTSNRPSKPNLPNVPKPSKLLLQRGYAEPISSLASQIPLLNYSINQYEIGSFLTISQNTKQPSHKNGYGEKMFWQGVSQGFDNGEEKSREI